MRWQHTDTAGQTVRVTNCSDIPVAHGVHVSLVGTGRREGIICIPGDQRQEMAQAVAEPDYRVVPVSEYSGDDLDAARAEIDRLKQTASMPEWERELLAGQGYEQEIVALKRERDDLHKELHDSAQPDRPEPVDPASVRVGDYACVESIDGITGVGPQWSVQGAIRDTSAGIDGVVRSLGFHVGDQQQTLWVDLIDATVRVLHRAEPEPDEAAVEALADIVHDVNDSFESTPLTKSATKRFVRELIRRGVEVPTDG